MLTCPMCKKPQAEEVRSCGKCGTNLSLLADYVHGLRGGLARAEELTRQGKLDAAVWAYLDVLEIEPDNGQAQAQVGRVAAAVRHFDAAAFARRQPGRFSTAWLAAALVAAFLLGITLDRLLFLP